MWLFAQLLWTFVSVLFLKLHKSSKVAFHSNCKCKAVLIRFRMLVTSALRGGFKMPDNDCLLLSNYT